MKNLTEKILLFGLVIIPFYEGILYLFMPSGKLPEFLDTRQTKEYLSIGMALYLTVVAWTKIKKIEYHNKWMLFFLLFLFFNYSKTPIAVANPIIDVSLLGSFPAEFKIFTFFLMFCSLASCKFSRETLDKIILTILLCSVSMAGYMILQAFNLDQIFKPKPEYFSTGVTGIKVGGFIGQPTLVLPFLVMSIPFAIYFKSIPALVILSISSLLTCSAFAVISLVALWFIYGYKNCKMLTFGIVSCLLGLYFFKNHWFFSDNGRFGVWWMILQDVFSGKINGMDLRIGMTGAGINNFGRVFTLLHESAYTRAHNEPLQVLWTCGIVGLGIYVMIHYDVFKTAFKRRKEKIIMPVIISISMLVLCSFGTFIFQLGVYQWYVVVLISLIYQGEGYQSGKCS